MKEEAFQPLLVCHASTATLSIKLTTSNFVLAQLLPGRTGFLLPYHFVRLLALPNERNKERKERKGIFLAPRAKQRSFRVIGRNKTDLSARLRPNIRSTSQKTTSTKQRQAPCREPRSAQRELRACTRTGTHANAQVQVRAQDTHMQTHMQTCTMHMQTARELDMS